MTPLKGKHEGHKTIDHLCQESLVARNHQDLSLKHQRRKDLYDVVNVEALKQVLNFFFPHHWRVLISWTEE